VGLGYVGLPLSMAFCEAGYRVIGVDIVSARVNEIQAGQSPVGDVGDDELNKWLDAGMFKPTTDYAALAEADAISICVPTPLGKSKDPDMKYVIMAAEPIAKTLRSGQVVILESTVYPGATEELILPILSESGLKVGEDFYLAFSPERVDPGNQKYTIRQITKVVGGITPACTEKAVVIYEPVFEQVKAVQSAKEAEMSKLLENTFRSINIGLINELAIVADKMDINIWDVIDAAATKPFGFMPFYPGPGLGGHCIPIDPFYLSWKAKMVAAETGFIELAGRINGQMPQYVLDRVTDLLNHDGKAVNGSKILILGMAYKRDVGDTRESPALDVLGLLHQRGADVRYNDPHVPSLDYLDQTWTNTTLDESTLADQDCVIIITDHSDYDYAWIAQHARKIFDTRNACKSLTGSTSNIELL
jgi:UDP-N-acetyl-D-glucosamine dehydrogenase